MGGKNIKIEYTTFKTSPTGKIKKKCILCMWDCYTTYICTLDNIPPEAKSMKLQI